MKSRHLFAFAGLCIVLLAAPFARNCSFTISLSKKPVAA
jgi:hypothetical protein